MRRIPRPALARDRTDARRLPLAYAPPPFAQLRTPEAVDTLIRREVVSYRSERAAWRLPAANAACLAGAADCVRVAAVGAGVRTAEHRSAEDIACWLWR
jgi:hypothetical protein